MTMRKVILNLAVSFDGFIEGPNGEIDWITFDDEDAGGLHAFLKEIDTVFYGRISYQMYGNVQVTANNSDFERDFYTVVNSMKKYVFTSAKTSSGTATVVSDEIAKFVGALKHEEGKDIWLYGGASLITTFMNLDLIDEYRVAIIPVVLGQGKPLFSEVSHRHKLKLLSVKTSRSGVMEVRYEALKN